MFSELPHKFESLSEPISYMIENSADLDLAALPPPIGCHGQKAAASSRTKSPII